MNKGALFAGVVGLSFVGVGNAAIIGSWTDEAAYLAATSGTSMESFESATMTAGQVVTVGDFAVSTDDTTWEGWSGISTSHGVTDGSQSLRYALDDGESIFFDFNSSITTFGVNYWGCCDVGGAPIITFYDELGNSEVMLAGNQVGDNQQFFGVLLDEAVTRVAIQMDGANGDGIFFDELYYGGGTSVPEPGTLALFSLGLAGIAAARKKRA